MDYEKKYKDALEWARGVMEGKVGFVLDEVLEKFPELKESEDEKIRKVLLGFIENELKKHGNEEWDGCIYTTDVIAWLEKQGEQNLANSAKTCKDEQNPADKVEPKFKVGDWITIKE